MMGAHEEVRGQLLRVTSLLLSCGFWGSDSSCPVGPYLYPLCHCLGLATLSLKFNNSAFKRNIVSVPCCYDRIPDKSKLQEEGFLLAHGLRNTVPHGRKGHGGLSFAHCGGRSLQRESLLHFCEVRSREPPARSRVPDYNLNRPQFLQLGLIP